MGARPHRPDPLEEAVADALTKAGVSYRRDDRVSGLDFYLLRADLYIEVKRFHTPRVADQLARRENVVVLQGEGAVTQFCFLLGGTALA